MILLSICIPVYRPNKKFVDKIIALSAQLAINTEIVIYIDGSFSKYKKIKTVFSYKVNVFGGEKNFGVAVARNTLICKAKGEYILWMDSDDNLDILNLEKLYTHLGSFDVLYADRYLIEPDNKRYISGFDEGDRSLKNLSKVAFISFRINREIGSTATCAKIIRKSVYDKVGIYDFRFRRSEDTEWFSRCLDHNELVFGSFGLPLVNQVYTINSNKSNKREWYYQMKMLAKYRSILSKRDAVFAYHWLNLKYLKKPESFMILSLYFFYRFYVKIFLRVLKPSKHIRYTL